MCVWRQIVRSFRCNTGVVLLAGIFLAGSTLAATQHVPQTRLAVKAVNRTNLAWQSDWIEVLSHIKAAGFDSVRLSYDPPFNKSLQTIIGATQKFGLKVLVMIPLTPAAYYTDPAARRAGNSHLYASNKLSLIDLKLYKEHFEELVESVIPSEENLVGFEIGNEINWADFNGDYPLAAESRIISRNAYTVHDLLNTEDGVKILSGLRKYLSIVKISRDVLNNHSLSSIPIITAGLFVDNNNWAALAGGRYLAPIDTLRVFGELGVLDVVNGIGMHFYPHLHGSPENAYADAVSESTSLLGLCQNEKLMRGKPCWITEWNVLADYSSPLKSCAMNDDRRRFLDLQIERLSGFVDAMAPLKKTHRLGPDAYIYSFDQGDRFAIWTCSSLNWGQ